MMNDIEKEIEEGVESIEEKVEEIQETVSEELEESVEEAKDTVSEALEESTEERSEEVEENTEEVLEDTVEAVVAGSVAVVAANKNVKKHVAAKQLVEEAKSIIDSNEEQMRECKLILDNDLKDYDDAKKTLNVNALDDAKALLVEIGHSSVADLEMPDEPVVFEEDDSMEPVYVRDVSSGSFTGLLLSVVAGAATLGGLVYWATEKLGMTLDIAKVPDDASIHKIANFFSNLVGMGDNAQAGMGVVALATLLVMFLVYKIRVALKGGSNLHFAEKQMKETQKYVTHKANCKNEMDRVDAHIKDAIALLKDYEILLNEQNGKLKRVLHFEHVNAEEHGYHHASIEEMKETQSLIEQVQAFISQPIAKKGKLSEESIEALEQTQEKVEAFLKRLI